MKSKASIVSTEHYGMQTAATSNTTYLERLFVLQDISKSLACFDAEGVASEVDFFEIGYLLELLEVWLDVGLCVELETLTDEGEDLGVVRHVV